MPPPRIRAPRVWVRGSPPYREMPQILINRFSGLSLWLACCMGGLALAYVTFNGRWSVAEVLAESVTAWNNKLLTPTRTAEDHLVRLVDLGAPATNTSQIVDLLDLLNYARARAVLLYLDIGRLTRGDAQQTEVLAAAIRRYAVVVLPEGPSDELGDWHVPVSVRNASAAVGHRYYLSAANRSVQGIGASLDARPGAPELHALQALAQVAASASGQYAQEPGSRSLAPERVRVQTVGLQLPYSSAPGQFPGPAVGSLVPGAYDLRELRGKVVVIGSTHENAIATPYDSLALHRQPARRMSEVEVAANYAAALLTGRVMHNMTTAQSAAIALVTVLLCAMPLLAMPPLQGYVACLVLGAATLPAWWYVAQERLLAFGGAPQAAAAVWLTGLLWIAVSLWRSRRNADRLLDQLRNVRLPMRLAAFVPTPDRAEASDSLSVAQAAIETARANQALTTEVIDSLPIAVLLVDHHGRVLAANRRTEQWFGQDDPVGRHIEALLRLFDFYGGNDASQLLRAPHHAAEARCNGRDVVVDARVLEHASRGPIRLLGIQDVSLVKQAINDRADAVDFLTHDLRTPLHSILVLTGLLEREAPAPASAAPSLAAGATMQQIRSMTERAIRLADNYVHLLRTDGVTAAGFTEVNLNDVVEEAIATSQPLALERRMVVRELGGPLCFVRGDYSLLFRAIVNVLGNAVRHAPEGTVIHIGLQCGEGTAQGMVAVCVRDEGQGFPSHLLGRNVDRYRVGKQPKAQGIGLGLALVEAVMRKHGGSLQLLNAAGGGAEARLTLPLEEVAAMSTMRLAS
jgi:signal transduction histidine kinase